jgi:epoxyqueuosine reductase
MADLKELIKNYAYENGIDLIGFAKARKFKEFEQYYDAKIQSGYTADVGNIKDMKRRLNVLDVMPHAKTMIAVAVSYNKKIDKPKDMSEKGIISHHVFAVDYHEVLINKMNGFMRAAKEKTGMDFDYKCFCDTGIADDRITAYLCGIGFFGKNNFIINEKYGSFIFLGHILTDLELEPDERRESLCKDCRACIDACPSKALRGEHICNMKICISNLTQKKTLSETEKDIIGRHIFGCNICQEVCKFNIAAPARNEQSFYAKPEDVYVECDEIINMTKEEFMSRYEKTALHWRGYETIKRNAKAAKNNINKENKNKNSDGGEYES